MEAGYGHSREDGGGLMGRAGGMGDRCLLDRRFTNCLLKVSLDWAFDGLVRGVHHAA